MRATATVAGTAVQPTGTRARASTKLLALGGHDFTSGPADRALCELIQRTAAARARGRPRICMLPSADEDASGQVSRFQAAFADRPCDASEVSLFRFGRRPAELREHLLGQDLIYVAGGSLPTLITQWEQHGVAEILNLAWRRGTVLAGQGAGATCWFEEGIFAASAGMPRSARGLGLLPGSLCVQYDGGDGSRTAYLDAVGDGMPAGYGIDRHAALLWEGTAAPTVLTAQRGRRAYRVEADAGGVAESPLPARFLPAPAPAALREDIAEYRRITAMRKHAGWLG